ncbi:MAG: radical SAM protein [Candidatus Nanoarchaeia archaeon]
MALVKVTRDSGIPLMGCIAFGIIDRGTNLIQVRPTSICNLKCPFCSTNANNPEVHPNNYEVELSYLVDWVKEVVKFKGQGVEINFDSVGEVLTYKDFVKLVDACSKIDGVSFISMQTNGFLLTEKLIDDLGKAGMNRINLSLNSLDAEKAKKLCGINSYNLDKIIKIAEYISQSKIELLIAPVWLPNINDEDIEEIIKFAKSLNARLGIQKYEIYKYGRKYKGAKHENWWKFYNKLKLLEKKYGINLVLTNKDVNVVKKPRMKPVFKKGEKVNVVVKAPGWIKGQMIGVANNRCISINDCKAKMGDKVKVKIVEDKNEIYIAEVL